MEKKIKILFVDDQEIVLGGLKSLFKSDCIFEPFFAHDAKEADDLISRQRFSCLILDLQLAKGISGIDLAKYYRQKIANPELKIILFTAYSTKLYEKYLVEPGIIDGCIDKLSDTNTLLETILQHIYLARKEIPKIKSIRPAGQINHLDSRDHRAGTHLLEGFTVKDNKRLSWVTYHIPGIKNTIGLASTIGCIGKCKFCLSRNRPFERILTAEEITDQVWHAFSSYHTYGFFEGLNELKINFTCEGDSIFSNLDNCCEAIQRLTTKIEGVSYVMTTIGHEENLRRLWKEYSHLSIELYWSLNFSDPLMRAEYMPATKNQSMEGVRDALQEYAEKTGISPTVSIIVMKGINDRPEDIQRLKTLLSGRPFEIKLMALEPNSLPDVKTTEKDVDRFMDQLKKTGLSCRKRKIIGGNASYRGAGCGTTVPCCNGPNDDESLIKGGL